MESLQQVDWSCSRWMWMLGLEDWSWSRCIGCWCGWNEAGAGGWDAGARVLDAEAGGLDAGARVLDAEAGELNVGAGGLDAGAGGYRCWRLEFD